MNDSVCCLPLKSVSGSEKSRLDHDGNQRMSIAANVQMMASFSLNTRTQLGTPQINDFVDQALWNR